MRWHKAFPRPGDRIRLAIPLPTDESEPNARYGTVLERSCGRSNALRVRWDREGGTAAAGPDAGIDTWLADAGWYWDKAHLEVIAKQAGDVPVAPIAAPVSSPSEEADWLASSPRPVVGPSGIGVDGSLDAVAEWEAALASEIDAGPDASWEQLLAAALGNGVPAAPARRLAPAPAAPAPPRLPAPASAQHGVHAAENGLLPHAAQPLTSHTDIRKRTPAPPNAAVHEPAPEATPVAAPVAAWAGDDILPRPRGGGKRWGRR